MEASMSQAPAARAVEGPGELVGEITHYFSRIEVCVVRITRGSLRVGERVRIKGHSSDFVQKVQSLQIESRNVDLAKKGHLVGLKVNQVARVGDLVYKAP